MSADISTTVVTVGGILVFLQIITLALGLLKNIKSPNDRAVAKLQAEGASHSVQIFATKAELDDFKEITREEIRRTHDKLEQMRQEILVAGETRAEVLHKRINMILSEVSEVRGELKRINP